MRTGTRIAVMSDAAEVAMLGAGKLERASTEGMFFVADIALHDALGGTVHADSVGASLGLRRILGIRAFKGTDCPLVE